MSIIPHYMQKRHNLGYACIGLGQSLAVAVIPIIINSLRLVTSYRYTCLYFLPLLGVSIIVPVLFKPRLPIHPTNYSVQSFIHPCRRFITIPYLVSACLCNSGMIAMIVLLYGYVFLVTESRNIATLTMTILGICKVAGAALFATILLKFKVNHYILHIICNLICGITAIVLGAFPHTIVFYTMAALFGFFHAIIIANMGCVSKHLYPPRDIEYAFSYWQAMTGIGSLLGTYTAGLIQAAYGQSYGFYYTAAQTISGSLLLIFASLFKRKTWREYKKKTHADNDFIVVKVEESSVVDNMGFIFEEDAGSVTVKNTSMDSAHLEREDR